MLLAMKSSRWSDPWHKDAECNLGFCRWVVSYCMLLSMVMKIDSHDSSNSASF